MDAFATIVYHGNLAGELRSRYDRSPSPPRAAPAPSPSPPHSPPLTAPLSPTVAAAVDMLGASAPASPHGPHGPVRFSPLHERAPQPSAPLASPPRGGLAIPLRASESSRIVQLRQPPRVRLGSAPPGGRSAAALSRAAVLAPHGNPPLPRCCGGASSNPLHASASASGLAGARTPQQAQQLAHLTAHHPTAAMRAKDGLRGGSRQRPQSAAARAASAGAPRCAAEGGVDAAPAPAACLGVGVLADVCAASAPSLPIRRAPGRAWSGAAGGVAK